jgi:benzoyl-CoA reductase/2-hydroxyglutaryl-CoA dehydratase subunit BcrC/BadD/HgdB
LVDIIANQNNQISKSNFKYFNMSEAKSEIIKLESVGAMRKTMGDYFNRIKDASETRKKKIAWCSSVGPAELLYSMDFEVYFPENHGAMLGAGKNADKYIPAAVAQGYSPDICSYLTSDIGSFLLNETPLQKMGFESFPKPDVLVYNTNQCREVEDWFAFYARHYKVPLMGIHTPLNINNLSKSIIQNVAEQFKDIIPELEKVATQKFDIDKFKETIGLSHDGCVLWRQVLETAMNVPSPISFFDAAIHMGPIVVMRGTQYAIDYYKILLAELQYRIKNNISAVPKEKLRLYWDGMPLWFKLSSMAKMFISMDTCVVASTYYTF